MQSSSTRPMTTRIWVGLLTDLLASRWPWIFDVKAFLSYLLIIVLSESKWIWEIV